MFKLIQQMKDEADKLEESRKLQLLDLIDSFQAAVATLLDPKMEEDDDSEPETPEKEIEPIAGLD